MAETKKTGGIDKKVMATKASAKPVENTASKTSTKKASQITADVLSLEGKQKSQIVLPEVFLTEYRPDLILRAFVAEQSWDRQPYGSDPRAGFRTTAEYYSRRREYYRLTVNRGISRLPRQKRAGGGLGEVRRVPHSKGGHRAHPPKVEKDWAKKINKKEWILALNSAIAATVNQELASSDGRNHALGDLKLPLIIENTFESIDKTKDVYAIFEKLGLADDVSRASVKKTKEGRARTGKRRLRKSVLLVVSDECLAAKAAKNIAGVDVIDVDGLNIDLLAPGGHPGRLTLWTQGAIEKISS